MAIGIGMMGPNQASMALQTQKAVADQQRLKTLEGVKNGNINQDEFRHLATDINSNQGPNQDDIALMKREIARTAAPRTQPSGSRMMPQQAFMAAQMQMYKTDQTQAQIVYGQISRGAQSFNGLYEKYSQGDFHPEVKLSPDEAARLDQVFTKMKSGEMTTDSALNILHEH